ncbi:DUF4270 family protein [Mucilaginibacter ginkgonis]|uniref:DUF4270 family protein n=1 Tax=Mucilaginibacter ginkgonis TaxID=2682091 RepID=A0A6I4HXY5_9SPHI|nr:DUF4270 family protein [Mucilaginibacter ginkgonis]QQL49350.1 DUF4270 family protein [Mucilaginibacter ginkgonis]
MKFFRLDLLTLLISLFLLNSCKNQNNLGLIIDPSQQVNGTLTDTSTLWTNTVSEDTVVTSGLAKTPLAYFKDPIIGTSEANIAAAISLPGNAGYTLPSGTLTIDSAVLILRYADGFYGDSLTSKYKANIYQLAEKPSATTTYYNNKIWSVSNVLLGSQTFNSRTHTPFKITDIVTGKPDTLKSVPAQLRVKISTNFIASNLFNANSTTLGSNTLFQNQVKGLYITLDKTQAGNGGRFFINGDSSRIDVYYKAVNPTTAVIDTAVVSLPLAQRAAEIKHTYTTAVTAALNTTAPQETIYLDGLGGLRAKIAFPYIKNFLATAGANAVISRAELVITPVPGSNISYKALPRLTMYRFDIAKQRIAIPDATGGSTSTLTDSRFISAGVFGGIFNNLDNSYHFIITGYVSDLARGKTPDYGTYIAPIDTTSLTTVPIAATPQTAARTYATGGVTNKASANFPYRMKLNIIYTKATQ